MKNWREIVLAHPDLGRVPDTQLARELGCSKLDVYSARKDNGIQNYLEYRRSRLRAAPDLFDKPLRYLSRKYRVDERTVEAARITFVRDNLAKWKGWRSNYIADEKDMIVCFCRYC